MTFIKTLSAALLVTTIGHGALAQETSEGDTSENTGPNVEIDQYQDWVLRCENSSQENTRSCVLFQRLVMQDTGQVVLQATMALPKDPEESPLAVFTLPLGIYLPYGAEITVDDGQPVTAGIETCIQRGCTSVLPLDDELLEQMRSGQKMRIRVKQNEEKNLDFELSLNGFTAGFGALTN